MKINKEFYAGFTLAGYEQPDGSIKSCDSNETMKEWPKEITVEGITFTLEEVRISPRLDNPKGRFMNAEYV